MGYGTFTFKTPPRAFARINRVITDLGSGYGPEGNSWATDINNKNEIVGGRKRNQRAPTEAFLYKNNAFIDLGTLGATTTNDFGTNAEAEAINSKSQIVGQALRPAGSSNVLRGFIWEKGVMRDIGSLGNKITDRVDATDINDLGHIVGESQNNGNNTTIRAFIWRNGVMTNLGALDGKTSHAYGINEKDQVVGLYVSNTPSTFPGGSVNFAFKWENGQMVDLNKVTTNLPKNVSLEIAYAINDDGVIVGRECTTICEPGKDTGGRAFMLIPNN